MQPRAPPHAPHQKKARSVPIYYYLHITNVQLFGVSAKHSLSTLYKTIEWMAKVRCRKMDMSIKGVVLKAGVQN